MPQEYSPKESKRGSIALFQTSPVIETLGEILELTDSEDGMDLTDFEASEDVIELTDSEPSGLVTSRILKSNKKVTRAKATPSVRRSAYSSVFLIALAADTFLHYLS